MPPDYFNDLIDVYIDLKTGTARDVLTLMPTFVYQGALISGTNPIDAPVIVVHGASLSGIEDAYVKGTFGPSGAFPEMFGDFEEGTESLFSTGLKLSQYINTSILHNYTTTNNNYIRTLVTFLTAFELSWFIDIDVDFYYGIAVNRRYDTETEFKIYKGKALAKNDTYVDLFLHNSRQFVLNFDLYSVLMGTPRLLDIDLEVESGVIVNIPLNLYSAYENNPGLLTDLFNSAQNDIMRLDSEVEVASGRTQVLSCGCFSSASETKSIGCDIRPWSLEAGTFFLDVGEYTTVSATAWVDVVDSLIGVSTSGTYFKVNGVEVPVTFSGINNGYRMFYNPPDNFDTDGVLVYTAHIRNLAGDAKDVNYYLLGGYSLVHNDTIRWDPNKQVDIWMTATNLGFCPETTADSYYFRTKELMYSDLRTTIVPVGFVDLGAVVYPQSTFFFYGETYTITMSGVKDFSGNEMDQFIYTFTIDDPTS